MSSNRKYKDNARNKPIEINRLGGVLSFVGLSLSGETERVCGEAYRADAGLMSMSASGDGTVRGICLGTACVVVCSRVELDTAAGVSCWFSLTISTRETGEMEGGKRKRKKEGPGEDRTRDHQICNLMLYH